jgi:hypothetical protein
VQKEYIALLRRVQDEHIAALLRREKMATDRFRDFWG